MPEQPTRLEHLAWCKQRAHEYLAYGDWQQAMASFLSDLSKHPDQGDAVQMLGAMLMLGGQITNTAQARAFIDGTN